MECTRCNYGKCRSFHSGNIGTSLSNLMQLPAVAHALAASVATVERLDACIRRVEPHVPVLEARAGEMG